VRVLLATRSPHKVEEIREILDAEDLPSDLVGLTRLGIEPSPEEDDLEPYDTFEENALSKARYFRRRSGLPTLSDDSGLVVDALDGEPGVRSKRYSPAAISGEVTGQARDDANNAHLLRRLEGVVDDDRTARYVCAVALIEPDGTERIVRGEVEGRITTEPSGQGGFGYDPLFFVPELGRTFGDASADEKHRLSHRGRAFRRVVSHLRTMVEET